MTELNTTLDNNTCFRKEVNIERYDFITNFTDQELIKVSEQACALPQVTLYGEFINTAHYLASVDLLIASTRETEHRNEILFTKILPRIKSFGNLLDIGVGNGMLTKDVGQYFTHITVNDISVTSLNTLPDYHWNSNTTIHKLHGSVIDIEIPEKNYDLIMLSHVLYYIPLNIRSSLINKLYNLLSSEGAILMIFNEGGTRYELTKNFNGSSFEFSDIKDMVRNNYTKVEIIESKEAIVTQDLTTMQHIAGVCLCDASTTASAENLSEYLNMHNYDGKNYNIDMIQNIILIGELNDYSDGQANNLAKDAI